MRLIIANMQKIFILFVNTIRSSGCDIAQQTRMPFSPKLSTSRDHGQFLHNRKIAQHHQSDNGNQERFSHSSDYSEKPQTSHKQTNIIIGTTTFG